jgi:hypothetical protein
MPAYHLSVHANERYIEIAGGLPYGTTAAVRRLLRESPRVRIVYLNSVGGWINEGFQLKAPIQAEHMDTYATKQCLSACTIAVLGGSDRFLGPEGRLGFHRAAIPGWAGAGAPIDNARWRAALTAAGASPSFIDGAMSTSPSDLLYPTRDELLQSHVVTIVDAPNECQSASQAFQCARPVLIGHQRNYRQSM